jgi:hypothetical protein
MEEGMLKRRLAALAVVVLFLTGATSTALVAQVSSTTGGAGGTALSDVKAAIVRVLSADEKAVDVTATPHLIIVSLNNSGLKGRTHAERNTEATAIASTVVMAISEKPAFKNVLAINVRYLSQSGPGAHQKLVDSIDFRKDRSGKFGLHLT